MTRPVRLAEEGKGFFQFDTTLNSRHNIAKACQETNKLSNVVTPVPGLAVAQ